MTDNRYRPRSPPRTSRYNDPRASTGPFYSNSFDPGYVSQPRSAVEPYPSARHGSIYDTRPVKSYSYKDDAYPGSTVSRTEYAVRPRTNSNLPSESRRPVSMIMKNTSPTRRPVVSNSSRDDSSTGRPAPYVVREEPSRYLVPASTHRQGNEHHQRHYSATRADQDRLSVAGRSGGRARGEYHQAGGYGQKSYASSRSSAIKDDDYSYTGPREQFDRDMQARAPPPRDSHTRRERPMSVVEIPEFKQPAPVKREAGPPPASRQLDRIDREDRRLSTRPIYEEDRASDLPTRRQSVRAPVVHQSRDEGYPSTRDDVELRPKPRRERIEEEEPLPKIRIRERIEGEEPLPKIRTRDLDRDYERERDHPREVDRERDRERDKDRDRDLRDKDRDRERDRDRESYRERDYERDRDRDKPRDYDKVKVPEERRQIRSRESSPERSGVSKGVAGALGGAAVAGLAGAALKSSAKPEDMSDSDTRERRRRKHRHRDRADEDVDPREPDASDRRALVPADDRQDDRLRPAGRPDESASESFEDDRQRRRHRRRKHRDRDDPEVATAEDPRAPVDSLRPEREAPESDEGRHRRRAPSRSREIEEDELERRTISPGEDEDDRPRRVQLVEPEAREVVKPRGILKKTRLVPFPEDPNPTREGVAPLKDAGKDGVPVGARWTKISRVLVNPEALLKAHERFEERDDYVIVLRVVSREEIQKFAEKTRELREAREKQWQEDLEKQKHQQPEPAPHPYPEHERRRHDDPRDFNDGEDKAPQPLLDQHPAQPGIDPRDLINPATAPSIPGGLPVPDIRLPQEQQEVEHANYSTNV